MRPAIRLAALLSTLAFSACVYRMDIQQGNLLDLDQIEQLEVGMTRSQVRFLLGTPMVIDSFDADRWDYVYSLQRGRSRQITRRHLIVWFEGDTVTRIEEPIPLPRPASSTASEGTSYMDATPGTSHVFGTVTGRTAVLYPACVCRR
jgi:outer membrane protein assembly factor BamE